LRLVAVPGGGLFSEAGTQSGKGRNASHHRAKHNQFRLRRLRQRARPRSPNTRLSRASRHQVRPPQFAISFSRMLVAPFAANIRVSAFTPALEGRPSIPRWSSSAITATPPTSASLHMAADVDVVVHGLMRSVVKFGHETKQPNGNSQDTDSRCRRVRSFDYPQDAKADYSERNEIGQRSVSHGHPSQQICVGHDRGQVAGLVRPGASGSASYRAQPR